jgi:hypothetical protein
MIAPLEWRAPSEDMDSRLIASQTAPRIANHDRRGVSPS